MGLQHPDHQFKSGCRLSYESLRNLYFIRFLRLLFIYLFIWCLRGHFRCYFFLGYVVPDVVVSHIEAGKAQELLKLSVIHSVLVHDGGGRETEFVGVAVFYSKFLTAFLWLSVLMACNISPCLHGLLCLL